MVASLRRLEASVAQVLGISLIHAVPEIMLQPPYTECLQRLAAAGEPTDPMVHTQEACSTSGCSRPA